MSARRGRLLVMADTPPLMARGGCCGACIRVVIRRRFFARSALGEGHLPLGAISLRA